MAISLNTNALLTGYAELNTFTNMGLAAGDSDYANTLINAASDFIENYLGRAVKATAYTSEVYSGDGGFYLFLKNIPINSITSVVFWDTYNNVADTTYTANTDYMYDSTEGWIYLRSKFYAGVNNYKITYNGGYSTIPYNIRQACAMYCSWMNLTRGKTGMDSERIGDYSYKLSAQNSGSNLISGMNIPQDILSLLSKYRKVSIA